MTIKKYEVKLVKKIYGDKCVTTKKYVFDDKKFAHEQMVKLFNENCDEVYRNNPYGDVIDTDFDENTTEISCYSECCSNNYVEVSMKEKQVNSLESMTKSFYKLENQLIERIKSIVIENGGFLPLNCSDGKRNLIMCYIYDLSVGEDTLSTTRCAALGVIDDVLMILPDDDDETDYNIDDLKEINSDDWCVLYGGGCALTLSTLCEILDNIGQYIPQNLTEI